MKIIELFEEDPAFSGISSGVESGKPLYSCLQVVTPQKHAGLKFCIF